MHIELIAIGNELLKGKVQNTNGLFITQKLIEKGYAIFGNTTLKDDTASAEKIANILERSDLVIMTGGLGPTVDDRTKEILCQVFDTNLILHEDLLDDLNERFAHSSVNEEQATQPEMARLFSNPIGSAPALLLKKGKKTLIALPGVPREMKEIFTKDLLPFIEKKFPLKNKIYSFDFYFYALKEEDVDHVVREIVQQEPALDIGVYPFFPTLGVTFSVDAKDEKEAQKKIEKAKQRLLASFKENLYSTEEEAVEKALHKELVKQKKTLAFAESCTGGALASHITAIAGASSYFLGSVVSYHNSLKENILQVDPVTVKTNGVVSKAVVEEMTKGLLQVTEADIVAATSGIAGPEGGTNNKPVGTVYISIQQRGQKPMAGKIFIQGDREFVIAYTCRFVLSSLWRWLVYQKPPLFL